MEIDVARIGQGVVVSVTGRMDTITAPVFQQRIEQLIDQGEKNVVVDLKGLEYVSSAGLRSILIGAKKTKAEGGRFSCCSLQAMVGKVFDVSGFRSIISVFDSREAALNKQ